MSQAAFGKKDLGLILDSSTNALVGDAESLRHTRDGVEDNFKPLEPKVDKSKFVKRYFPGQKPDWVEKDDEEDGNFFFNRGGVPQDDDNEDDSSTVDARLQRLQGRGGDKGGEMTAKEKIRRRRIEAQVLIQEDNDEDKSEEEGLDVSNQNEGGGMVVEEEDDEAMADRRRRIREKLKERQRQEAMEQEMPITEEGDDLDKEDEDDGEDSDEWETDTDDDEDAGMRVVLKPVFKRKKERETIILQEKKEEEKKAADKKRLAEAEERKQETRNMVAEEIKREQTKDNNPNDSDDEADMPDDDDDVNEDEEFELWKLRELKRIKRDRDERAAVEFERKETERRRHLTDAQRMAEDRASGKLQDKDKAKWKFMQKYYHKGAFYVDEDSVKVNNDVRLRDANGATLNDKFDKSALPKIMQVKNFGRQGQTKYTHLVDQDTTQFESAWTMNDGIRSKYQQKMGGISDSLEIKRKRKRD